MGGKSENSSESVIIVENSTISDILFENIKTIHGFRNALEVNEWNPNFNMSEETIFLLNIAANGKNIIIKEYKKGNETEEKEEMTTEEEESGWMEKRGIMRCLQITLGS